MSRAIYREVEAGRGTEHKAVYLDVSHRGEEYIKRKLPSMYEQFHALGDVDITKQPMEVYPTIHYTMGGVRAEPETCATTVPGLFAAGEVAAGLHGANRLGGNSLSDIIVFGKRAGEGAAALRQNSRRRARSIRRRSKRRWRSCCRRWRRKGGENPYKIHQELQEIMQKNAMIARTEEGLLRGAGEDQGAAGARQEPVRAPAIAVQSRLACGARPALHAARPRRSSCAARWSARRAAARSGGSTSRTWTTPYWGKQNLIATLENDHGQHHDPPAAGDARELKQVVEEYK